ncbi:acetyl esterase/lipase [Mobilisporobacter senegalensis]|uniref:Acetyl esterase/lipase n=1 Tax=Mobilisporobacter senegalensis TaxID=1329262 RepID=A0A3N1XAW2_9FIRM|nr:alpha/beta hydrolase [Mobilisporobacter senegalensis]ROR23890.1 acetyl esterase/lipase [Mobilisporobacter senegalensis]
MTRMNQNVNLKNYFFKIMLLFNGLAFLSGILYQCLDTDSFLWNIYGFIMLPVFGLNAYMAYVDFKYNWLSYIYLAAEPVIMILLITINLVVSSDPMNQTSPNIVTKIMIHSLFIMGMLIAGSNIFVKQRDKEDCCFNIEGCSDKHKMKKNVILLILTMIQITGLWISYKILKPHKGISLISVAHLSLFYAYIYLSTGFLIRKILKSVKYKILNIFVLLSTIVIVFSCFIPFITIPLLIHNGDKNYSVSFGEYYKLNPIFKNSGFRQSRFYLPEYFYGTKSKGYKVMENILFYEGKEEDAGLKLYFDVYSPETGGENLPGKNSVLIRIHGGGWAFGDKGILNSAQMNKYFANQGYIVFDIQYGFSKFNPLYNPFIMKDVRYGDYTIDDMVRHIGKFTTYLAEHRKEYDANINSVFISGGSAGGNLSLAAGLGIASEKYTNILDSRIKIKGLIPFYPANEIPVVLGIGNRNEFINPGLLADKKSPPCLIFQGTHDGIVDYTISERFRDSYLGEENEKCAIIYMPFGEHGCDAYFSGYYNQVFLYYMERFMYQYR